MADAAANTFKNDRGWWPYREISMIGAAGDGRDAQRHWRGRSLFSVDSARYQDATGISLPSDFDDVVHVDRRGYSPDIGKELEEHYLNGKIVIFDKEQLDAPLLADVIDYVPVSKGPIGYWPRKPTPDTPVTLVPRYHHWGGGSEEHDTATFLLRAVYDPEQFAEAYDAHETRQAVARLNTDALQQEEYVAHLVERAGTTNTDEIHPAFPCFDTRFQDRFRFHRNGTTGYVMNPENPLLITIGGDETPFEEYNTEDWADLAPDDAFQELYDQEHIRIDADDVLERLNENAHHFLNRFKQAVDGRHPRMDTGYDRLQQYLEMEDELPAHFHMYRGMLEDEDLSLPQNSETSWEHLLLGQVRRLEGTDQFYEELLRDVQEHLKRSLEDEETDLQFRRLRGLETCLGDIQNAYREWTEEWSAGRGSASYVIQQHDLEYNADAIHRFCTTTELEENDGAFISALINDWDGDYIELPDMSGVDYLGRKNDGTEIIVNGDVGQYGLGKHMSDGRIEVKGDARYAGSDATGGEIYVHGYVREKDWLYDDCDAEIYTLKGGWLRKKRWKKIN